jgi:hypothetical protein
MDDQSIIFLAHSSQDIEDAALVQSLFGKHEHKAILLELEQYPDEYELGELFKKEVTARDWLIVLTGENTNSALLEEEFMRVYHKPVFYIEQGRCYRLSNQHREDCFEDQVVSICSRLRIFMSYAIQDQAMAGRITYDLEQLGYLVEIGSKQLRPGDDWNQAVERSINKALAKGSLVVLLSANANRWMLSEIEFTPQFPGQIIPCLIRPEIDAIPPALNASSYLDFMSDSYEQVFRQLIHMLRE